ncbi:basal-body rod modification protein FlgD [Oxobacter pfennigii]|uniref:Basal-body rod modification protein FlgD n=1 Tax=Oxobacter pfennigii TaxID=36849 RepID=A0A0P8W9N9_9CLOT|nr:flagellar hook capping FlgD N-terminal domain-containing protein [Oxobacter pfennigii]KPU44693.1 basal-body rod modification protein FlgD [Oxobacter pfennigii]
MKVYNTTTTTNTATAVNSKSELGKDAFLKILASQLQNQDPLNPQNNAELVAQMAQFSALEQMQNLNLSMNNLILSQKVNEANMLIGKIVKVTDSNGDILTDIITGTKAGKNAVNVVIDGKEFNVDEILEVVNDADMNEVKGILYSILLGQSAQQMTSLIGKTAKIELDDGGFVVGRIESVRVTDGMYGVVIDGVEYGADKIVELFNGGEQDVIQDN